MQARQYMIDYREKRRFTRDFMANKLKISPKLLEMLEENDQEVTHPEIVKDIAKAYRLTKEQKTMMLPPNYRPGPDYDPDRYKYPDMFLDTLCAPKSRTKGE